MKCCAGASKMDIFKLINYDTMFIIKMVLLELSELCKVLNSNNMTPEEYIKSKRREDYPGGHLCYIVSEKDALKAIEMARNEKQIK